MKKRNKKYNKLKSVSGLSKRMLQDILLVFSTEYNEDSSFLFNTRLNKVLASYSENTFKAMYRMRHRWVIAIMLITKERNGKTRTNILELAPPNECFYDQVVDSAISKVMELAKEEEAKGNEINSFHYIANPLNKSIEHETLEQIIETMKKAKQ